MNQRSSRLGSLLRVRRLQEDVARARLIAETSAEQEARSLLVAAEERYAGAGAGAAVQETREFLAERRHREALAGSVRAAGREVESAAESTGIARQGWSEAAMRVAALDRLEERFTEAARLERLAAEQRTAEEASAALRQSRAGRGGDG